MIAGFKPFKTALVNRWEEEETRNSEEFTGGA